ncbi:SWIM zinc finger family protein [Streptomyces sp. NPDC086077]|uniref:SWIM zinc finger family protein n=1 Tax=Streptomyces sp. NPDC086077 TaxID=3154862 RepID=UPI00343FA1ED
MARRALWAARGQGSGAQEAGETGEPSDAGEGRSLSGGQRPDAAATDAPGPDEPSSPAGGHEPRPGDAARAALRRAVSARRAVAGETGEGEASGGGADRGPGGSSETGALGGPSEGGAFGAVAEAGALGGPSEGGAFGAVAEAGAFGEIPDAGAFGEVPGSSAPREVPDSSTRSEVRGADTSATAPSSTRPADVARDALRAARSQREAQQAREDVGTTGVEPVRPSTPRRPADRSRRPRALGELAADAFKGPAPTDASHERHTTDDGPGPTTSSAQPSDMRPEHDGPTAPALPGTPSDHAAPVAASARAPRSMASPHRDGDLRRTFPAFPPRLPGDDASFAETWWGNAWISALERGALDVERLARGRGYAQQGRVDAITVTPGLVLAYVRGSRPRPYRVQVRLRTLQDADWERFLDAAADRPGHIAALLDKEMPQSLADGDVPLLPVAGDLDPRCSCPDRGHPCKHAAALCYQTARLLDADPFVLLLLRGRGEREVLDALSRRNATRAARAAQEKEPAPLPGIRATDALARRELPPPPGPLPAPPHPEQPPVYPGAPGGPDPFALDQLATDAAARAHALLVTGRDPVAELTLWQDAVRLAAARPGSGLTAGTRALYSSLAFAVGRTPAELARAVAAWRQGGLDGLAVLEEPWDPPAGRFDRARPLLLAADLPAFRPWRNRLTHPNGHVQLRLGHDGLWYAYESEPGQDDWWPRGTPDPDPVGALTGLGGADDL